MRMGIARDEADLPGLDHRQGLRRRRQRARPQVRRRATRTRSASRRSTCSSTPRRSTSSSTSTPCSPAVGGHELEERVSARADAVGARDRHAGLPHRGRRRARAAEAARLRLRGRAREKGLRVGSAGTHPFSLFERQRITARDRYRNLVDQMQYIARRELIFGLHVHVAVDDPEKAIQVDERARSWTCPRCSRSRPARRSGAASRPASARAGRWSSPPSRARARRRASRTTTSTPRSWASSRRRAASPTTRTSGGTSACTRSGARSRCGSATPSRGSRTPSRSPPTARRSSSTTPSGSSAARRSPNFHRILTTENKWLAARYGLEAPLMDLATGRRNRVALAQLVRRRLKELEPHARELGSERELEGIRDDPRARQRRRPPAARLQREPRHRRGRARDRERDRGRRALPGLAKPQER